MSTSPPEETRNEIATPGKKASRKTAAGRTKDVKGKTVPNKEVLAAPNAVAPKTKTVRKRANAGPSAVVAVTAEERRKMIAAAAYYKAQARGFAPGNEEDDWLLAEREVDTILPN